MFFYLSKLIAVILNPIHLFLLLIITSLLLSIVVKKRPKRTKRAVLSLSTLRWASLTLTVFLAVNLVVPILPYQAVKALEHSFEQPDLDRVNPAVIIVLGGWQGAGASFTTPYSPPISSAGDRLITGLILAKRFPEAKLYLPGGLQRDQNAPSESDISRMVLAGLELPSSRFIIEGTSRNTAENASYIRAMVDDISRDQVLLITSASHMPRAMGSFRAEGINPIAYPVDYKTHADRIPWTLTYKSGNTLTGIALHEWVGLLAYYVTGRSAELLPKP